VDRHLQDLRRVLLDRHKVIGILKSPKRVVAVASLLAAAGVNDLVPKRNVTLAGMLAYRYGKASAVVVVMVLCDVLTDWGVRDHAAVLPVRIRRLLSGAPRSAFSAHGLNVKQYLDRFERTAATA
jgi:hypothetical protein